MTRKALDLAGGRTRLLRPMIRYRLCDVEWNALTNERWNSWYPRRGLIDAPIQPIPRSPKKGSTTLSGSGPSAQNSRDPTISLCKTRPPLPEVVADWRRLLASRYRPAALFGGVTQGCFKI